VGRGKSFLMDAFFRLVPVEAKRRVHFHRFMQSIHHRLRQLQGQAAPLGIIAERVAKDTRLLCLDELHVTDIGDAMLMRGLLEGLFERGVALVTTSNQHPEQLYEHGLQRAQFEPAVELLKRHTEVVELDGEQDYRLRTLERAGVYHWPLDMVARRHLEQAFEGVAGEHGEEDAAVEIDGRSIRAARLAPGTAWFDFRELCEGPRGTADYIELARRYHTVLLWGLRRFVPGMAESMRRFTWLIDEFYDRNVKLIAAAEVAAHELHAAVPAAAELERTRSRLIEMQTAQYLSRPHLA
jgi:cell division protein ZapE